MRSLRNLAVQRWMVEAPEFPRIQSSQRRSSPHFRTRPGGRRRRRAYPRSEPSRVGAARRGDAPEGRKPQCPSHGQRRPVRKVIHEAPPRRHQRFPMIGLAEPGLRRAPSGDARHDFARLELADRSGARIRGTIACMAHSSPFHRALRVWCFLPVVAIATLVAVPAPAQPLTADETAFFGAHLSEVVKVEPSRLTDPALGVVFGAPLYTITVSILYNDGGLQTEHIIVARSGSRLVKVDCPPTDDAAPLIAKLLSPSFRLRADQDGIVLQRALDVALPIASDAERKTATFKRDGNQWSFVRNHFFGAPSGFVFTTDAKGAITSAKYLLKLSDAAATVGH